MSKREKILALLVLLAGTVAATNSDIMTFTKVVTLDAGFVAKSSDRGTATLGSTCVTETIDSGAGTETITAVIPAKVDVIGVTCRVDTVIVGAGATTFALGDGTDADLYGTGLAFAAGTTVGTANYTANPDTQAFSTSAGDLTMTANAGQFDTGAITCCSHYITFAGPAS